ncbi:MAG TPA: aldehyde dehydrogenase family protein, partial [Candidatus Ozemobacteraceae bacterium]|nr:aldehyde dehydrogenase family protein [Candidatus Ozemobacteraceae bacterium]
MSISRDELGVIVQEVLRNLKASGTVATAGARSAEPSGKGIFENIEDAIKSAVDAQKKLVELPVALRRKMIDNMRARCLAKLEELARIGVEDTGYGRVDDKIQKNRLAITKTPGLEDLQPVSYSGDDGLTLVEQAPYGVIGAITPSTNPSETIICNSIGMIAAGNAVVFGPHPGAAKISRFTVELLNDAVVEAG